MATPRTHCLVPLILLTAISMLPVVFSCSDRNAQARLTMAAADSLITAAPQAALDTLMTIDSSDAARLPRADRVFHTLLRTEAEYKCWLPVAENTAISEAVDYYRRNGPEDRLARKMGLDESLTRYLKKRLCTYKDSTK